MPHLIRLTVAAVLTVVAMGGSASAVNAPEHVIKYRQNLMKSAGAHLANVVLLAQGRVDLPTGWSPTPRRSSICSRIPVWRSPREPQRAIRGPGRRSGKSAPGLMLRWGSRSARFGNSPLPPRLATWPRSMPPWFPLPGAVVPAICRSGSGTSRLRCVRTHRPAPGSPVRRTSRGRDPDCSGPPAQIPAGPLRHEAPTLSV